MTDLLKRWWRCPKCGSGIEEYPSKPFTATPVCAYCPMSWLAARETEYERLGKKIFQVEKMRLLEIVDLTCRVLPSGWEMQLSVSDSWEVKLYNDDGDEVKLDLGRDNLLTELEDVLEYAIERKRAEEEAAVRPRVAQVAGQQLDSEGVSP